MRSKRLGTALGAAPLTVLIGNAPAGAQAALDTNGGNGIVAFLGTADAVPERFLVLLKGDARPEDLVARYGGTIGSIIGATTPT